MIRMWPVPAQADGQRLDAALAALSGMSRATCAGLIEQGRVTLGTQQAVKSARVAFGDIVQVELPDPDLADPEPTVELPVVYQDMDMIVIDKPAGVAAHPSQGWSGPTVTGSLQAMGVMLTMHGPPERRGIVHRLDVGTSGLMMLAKSEMAYADLKDKFRHREVEKVYHTMVQGRLDPPSGTIDAPIDRHPSSSYRFAVMDSGRPSITHYQTVESFPYASLVEVELETGRTHQIRVHMSALRHPCCGDLTYGADPKVAAILGLERQWLHAVELAVAHPATGEPMRWRSEYAPDLAAALERARQLI